MFCVQFVTLATFSRYLWMKTSLVGSTNVRKRTGSFQRIGAVQRFFIQLQKAKKLQAFENFDVFSRFGTPKAPPCMHAWSHVSHFEDTSFRRIHLRSRIFNIFYFFQKQSLSFFMKLNMLFRAN